MKQQELKQWNAAHPAGTRVLAYPGGRSLPPVFTKILSEAWLLGDGTPVAQVEQLTGGIGLDFLDRSTEPLAAHESMMRLQVAEKVVRFAGNMLCEMAKRHVDTWKERVQAEGYEHIVQALADGASEEEVMRQQHSRVAATLSQEVQVKSEKSAKITEGLKKHREGGNQHV